MRRRRASAWRSVRRIRRRRANAELRSGTTGWLPSFARALQGPNRALRGHEGTRVMRLVRSVLALAAVVALAACSQGSGVSPQLPGAGAGVGVVPLGSVHGAAAVKQTSGVKVNFFTIPTTFAWPAYLTLG